MALFGLPLIGGVAEFVGKQVSSGIKQATSSYKPGQGNQAEPPGGSVAAAAGAGATQPSSGISYGGGFGVQFGNQQSAPIPMWMILVLVGVVLFVVMKD